MKIKRFFAWLLIFALIINSFLLKDINVNASNDESIDVYFTCEKSIIGQGLIIKPSKVTVSKDAKVSEVLDKVFAENDIKYSYSGTIQSGFYLSRIKNCDDGTFKIPELIKESNVYNRRVRTENINAPDIAEHSFIESAGWYYFVNGKAPNVGMSEYYLNNGDVIRIQLTLFGYGSDLDIPANRDKLIKKLANNKNNEYYNDGINILADFDKTKDDISDIIEKIDGEKESSTTENHSQSETQNNNNNNSNNNTTVNNNNDNSSSNDGTSENNGRRNRRRKSNSNTNNQNKKQNSDDENIESTSEPTGESNNNIDNNSNENNKSTEDGNNALSKDNSKKNNRANKKNDEDSENLIGIAKHEAISVTELIDEEHIDLIDDEIEKYKEIIEGIDLQNGGALELQWEIIALMSSGVEIKKDFLEKYKLAFNDEVKSLEGELSNKGTDYSKAIITMSSLGINHNEYDYAFAEKLKDSENICAQGINGPIWALMALSSSDDFDDYIDLKNEYYNILKNEWNEKQCFALMGDDGDVDLTAMAVLASGLYSKNNECDKSFIKDAVKFIEKSANDDGEFKSMENINVESLSYATMALLSVRDKDYDYNRAIDNILSYKTSDGLFAHLYEDKGSDNGNIIATQQAMLALCMISRAYHLNDDKLFYYADNNSDNVNLLNDSNEVLEKESESTLVTESKDNNSKENGNNSKCLEIVFIGLLVACLLCACLYVLLRAVRSKKEKK